MAKKSAKSIKKVSRNKKQYWRKGTDVQDIDAFAEGVRHGERLGIPSKSDSELFFIHKDACDDSGQKKTYKKVELRCYQNLKSDSAVPAFKEQKMGLRKTRQRLDKQLKTSAKNFRAKSNAPAPSKEENLYDLWDEKLKPTYPMLSPDVELGFLRITRQLTPKLPKSMKNKTTKLPSLELPMPGQSYNPSAEDHARLIRQAVVQEVEKINNERRLEEKLRPKGPIASEASKFAEACEGLEMFDKNKKFDENCETDDELDVKPDLSCLKPLLVPIDGEKRKTAKTRRRQKVAKLTKKQQLSEKFSKKREHEVFRLKSLNKEINAEQVASKERVEKRKKLAEQKMSKAHKLGKTRYEDVELDLHLSSELSGSFRLLKPQGSILEDRYKSLQRRNIVEPRRLQLSRKRKFTMKKYEKRGCDEITVEYTPR